MSKTDKPETNICIQASHEELCDRALKQYEEQATETMYWNSLIPQAIRFYRENYKPKPPICFGYIMENRDYQEKLGKVPVTNCQECKYLEACIKEYDERVYRNYDCFDDEENEKDDCLEFDSCSNFCDGELNCEGCDNYKTTYDS